MKIGEIIKMQREKSGISQMRLADELGCSRSHLSLWESGHSYPTFIEVIRIMRHFSLNLGVLSTVEVPPRPPKAEQKKNFQEQPPHEPAFI